jgi:hypothetical protein
MKSTPFSIVRPYHRQYSLDSIEFVIYEHPLKYKLDDKIIYYSSCILYYIIIYYIIYHTYIVYPIYTYYMLYDF